LEGWPSGFNRKALHPSGGVVSWGERGKEEGVLQKRNTEREREREGYRKTDRKEGGMGKGGREAGREAGSERGMVRQGEK